MKGKAENEDRIHGVGFAIHITFPYQLPNLPTCDNEWLIKLCLTLSSSQHAVIISVYAPTLTICDDNKETFYETLDSLMNFTPTSNKLIVLGNFNAKIGSDYENWKGVLGPAGLWKMNRNGLLLLTMCAENNLAITNIFFRLANKRKTTWMYRRSKQLQLIDYVIISCRTSVMSCSLQP